MHLVAVVFFRELAAIFLRQLTFRHKKAFPVWASLLLHLTAPYKSADIYPKFFDRQMALALETFAVFPSIHSSKISKFRFLKVL